MKIAYSWLKDYIDIDKTPQEISEVLTQTGLEIGSLEEVETVKGGLEGLVIGEVKTCVKHPNADTLSITTVDVGKDELLPIVCGAPNVAAGQKVVVATVGTTLYNGDDEFKIKKAKIRGEASQGMICAEDEIGLGNSHEGIMVLDKDAKVGMPAKEYFDIQSDWVFEIDLTPNRIDGASHYGVARDLSAYYNQFEDINLKKPSVEDFHIDNNELSISVAVENNQACPRYAGVTISNIKVEPSPEWLQNRLKLIGLLPINNIVDITNYVLFETGQPLHAFDADKIKGNKIIVKTLESGTKFTTLDDVERELHENDLMICDEEGGMCIGGVFGGINSGVKDETQNIFLESAYFDPVYIRKTARRHGLNTDASFRFERGIDPNNVIYSLKRAALLIKEIAGGDISSEIVDIYPNPIENHKVEVSYNNIHRLIGEEIDKERIKTILTSLDIEIEKEVDDQLSLIVPAYRVDVTREADIIEEILRIYGYNNIKLSNRITASLQNSEKPNRNQVNNLIADMLTAQGFNEIWSNSLTKSSYYEELEQFSIDKSVKILNPLSQDLDVMRQTLLFGGLESIAYNSNRQNKNLRLYEFGNCYFKVDNQKVNPQKNYDEENHLALFISGNKNEESWQGDTEPSTFFNLKSYAEKILQRLGFTINQIKVSSIKNELFADGLSYEYNNNKILDLGIVADNQLKKNGIDFPVFYADFDWDKVLNIHKKHQVLFEELPKYPSVRRDLALLIDKDVSFEAIKSLAFKTERKLLKEVDLFDIYEGKGVADHKKSYAIKFILRDENKTLNDKVIDKTMQRLISAFERSFQATLR